MTTTSTSPRKPSLIRSRSVLDTLRPWGERLLFFASRLLWALFILFVIAFVAFVGLEMARGTEPMEALVVGWQNMVQWLQGFFTAIWDSPILHRQGAATCSRGRSPASRS